ncbi:MAG: DUF4233 domain-containing protein [Actinobacteria bacterium]|nr:DUF4233 domain-containing protein [Actinomycetota bacterium]
MKKGQRIIGSSVLAFEAIAIWLAIPVAIQNHNISALIAIGAGGTLGLFCLLIIGGFTRGWAIPAGSALQPAVLLTGLWVPPMLFIGALFAVLWGGGLLLVRRAERIRQQRFGS